MHRTLFADRMESAIRDLTYLKAADDEAKNQEAMVEKEKTQVADGIQRAKTERTAVANLLPPGRNAQAASRLASKRRLPRTSRMRRKSPDCRKRRPI